MCYFLYTFWNTANDNQIDISKYFVPFGESDIEDYGEVMNVNSRGSFLVLGAVIKQMLSQDERTITSPREGSRSTGRGCIVNVASALPIGAVPNKPAYVASKHALLSITRAVHKFPSTHYLSSHVVLS